MHMFGIEEDHVCVMHDPEIPKSQQFTSVPQWQIGSRFLEIAHAY
jgi:hypothetical protein